MIGKVKWFDDQRGFGFITVKSDEEKDVFVHYSDIVSDDQRKTLKEGESVEFEIEKCEKGFKATDVRAVS